MKTYWILFNQKLKMKQYKFLENIDKQKLLEDLRAAYEDVGYKVSLIGRKGIEVQKNDTTAAHISVKNNKMESRRYFSCCHYQNLINQVLE